MKRSILTTGLLLGAAVLGTTALAQPPGRGGFGGGPGGPGGGFPPIPVLTALDADGNGELSESEIANATAALRKLDKNNDGKLTADELPRGPGGGRGGPGGGGPGRGGPGPMESANTPAKPPLPKDDGEKRILDALEHARGGERYANVSTADGRLLRQLTESLGAKRVVELGTSTGESGLWFSLGLRKTGGKLYTYDIDPGRIAVARANFKRAGVDDLIVITEGDDHETAPKATEPIDILFIDAEKEGYATYLKQLLPLVRPGGLIIAHNMQRPSPDPAYITAITTDPNLDTSFVLMDGAGVGITLKQR